jgi:hypothetical protein
MLRRTLRANILRASRPILSGGGAGGHHDLHLTFKDKEHPNMPHYMATQQGDLSKFYKNPLLKRMMDSSTVLYDDQVTGTERARYQDPARAWHYFAADDALAMEEHDKEEWNDKPYVTVNHLYEPPVGSEERPVRVECVGNPGDYNILQCFGNCAPHITVSPYLLMMKGYATNKCPMCQQFYYVHNRPWLVMHPDWTDEPASDEGPAYTFAEIESEFDRDFHEFSIYLNAE